MPAHNRWLQPRPLPDKSQWWIPALYGASFVLDPVRKRLIFDLGNSICRQTVGGPPVDLGTLTAMVHGTALGTVDYSQFAYENNAAIAELPLTDAQVQLVQSAPVQLVTSKTDLGPQTLFREDPSGMAFAVDQRSLRMTSEAGSAQSKASTRVYVTEWGVPKAGVQYQMLIQPVHGGTPNATVPPSSPGDTPSAEGALAATIGATDACGFATIELAAVKDPGSRTPELDGQLYFVYPVTDPSAPSYAQEQLLSVLLWSSYPINEAPTWDEIVAINAPYMKLYPAMKARIDLTDLHTFTVFTDNPPWAPVYLTPAHYNVLGISAGAIPFYMSRDLSDPRFMPVTRDMSPNKLTTMLYFCKSLQAKLAGGGS